MKHFNSLPANCTAIGTAEALLEAFFNVQIDAHVKAWRWKCYTEGKYHYCGKGIIYGKRS